MHPDNRNMSKKPPQPQPLSKQARKRREVAASRLSRHVESMNAILDAVEERPELWQTPELSHLREFILNVESHPESFPLPSLHRRDTGEDHTSSSLLTKGFASTLYSGTSFQQSGNTCISRPVVLVIRKGERKVSYCKLNNDRMNSYTQYFTTQYTLDVTDGDGQAITCKINTGLNHKMSNIAEGSVLQLESFAPIYFNWDPDAHRQDKQYCCILVHRFVMVGQQRIEQHHEPPRVPHVSLPVTETEIAKQVNDTDNGDHDSGNNQSSSSSPDSSSSEGPNEEELRNCNGRFCSLYGVAFIRCVTVCFPVNTRNLENIARICPFADQEVNQMNNSKKRFLLYYWYATNIYSITGRHNRKRMPPCLELKVREQFPDQHFTGFQDPL